MSLHVTPPSPERLEPGSLPVGSFVLGHLEQLKADALGMLMESFRTHGDVSAFRFGPIRALLVAHPEHIQHVLLGNHDNYDRRIVSYQRMKTLLGEGLLTSEGPFWRRQRRIAQPAFHHGRIVPFGGPMVQAARETAEAWRPAADDSEPIDVHREMMALTLRVAAETLVGTDVRSESSAVGQALNAVLRDFNDRLYALLPIPEWIPTPANRRLVRAKRTLDRLVLGIIEERRRSNERRDDLLARLMEARDEETGESMTDRQLRDEVMTILMAGHETTANALTFTFYLLAEHPEVAATLRAELDEVLAGRAPTVEDLAQTPYTKAVVEESMRLYPPAWVVERRAIADDAVGPYPIRAGTVVMISSWVTHRHPDFWDDPETFDPGRFLPGAPRPRHRFAYLPFGGGPRVCIGGGFALLEARLLLATLAQRYELERVPGPLELDPNVTLRPRRGLWMTPRAVGS